MSGVFRQSLTKSGAHHFSWTDCPASPVDLRVSMSPVLGLPTLVPSFHVSAADPDTGLHAFIADLLATESSPQP